eukprot:300933-Pyramimonas_sp.AAC.1
MTMSSAKLHLPQTRGAQRPLSRSPAGASGKSDATENSALSPPGVSQAPDRGSRTRPAALRADSRALWPLS